MTTRRSFLKQLAMGVSVLGSAGIFLPRAVDAYRWRRGLVQPVYGYKIAEDPLRWAFPSRELYGKWDFIIQPPLDEVWLRAVGDISVTNPNYS